MGKFFFEVKTVSYRAILVGLREGNITKLSELEPLIANEYIIPSKLLEIMLDNPNYDVELVRELSELVPKSQLNKLIKNSLTNGNWHYAEAMLRE